MIWNLIVFDCTGFTNPQKKNENFTYDVDKILIDYMVWTTPLVCKVYTRDKGINILR